MRLMSAQVSIWNSMSLLLSLSITVQGRFPFLCTSLRKASSSSSSFGDFSWCTSLIRVVLHCVLKWPFFPHLKHSVSLAGHCACLWPGVLLHLEKLVLHFVSGFPLSPKPFFVVPFPMCKACTSFTGFSSSQSLLCVRFTVSASFACVTALSQSWQQTRV